MATKFSSRRESSAPAGHNPIWTHFRPAGDSEVTLVSKDGLWKLSSAERVTDHRCATVFLCDKKALEQACKSKKRYEQALDVFRREVSNLDKYRHPNILTLLHCLEETPTSLAYAVERIAGTLESLLACTAERSSPTIDLESLGECKTDSVFEEAEFKYGLLQVTEALRFFHNVKHTSHRNISLRTIYVTPNGLWKLGGMAFVDKLYQEKLQTVLDPKLPLSAQPDLDFQPPEAAPKADCQNANNASLGAAGDMFSFGLIICAVCYKRPLFNTGASLEKYAAAVEQLTALFKSVSSCLPSELVGAVQRLLTRDAAQRISAQSFALLKYFHDEDVMLLQNLDSLTSKSAQQRVELFRKLRDCLPKLSKKIVYSHVLPVLVENVASVEYDVPVVEAYLTLIHQSTNIEFRSAVFSTLKQVIGNISSEAAAVTLLHRADVLSAKLNADELEAFLVPAIVRALESSSNMQNEAALKALPSVLQELDEGESETKKHIRDVLIRLIEQPGTGEAARAAVKAQALSCLYLVTQHDLAMKFALEQLLEQQLQSADVYQSLSVHLRTLLDSDLEVAFIADFALPALIRPLNYGDGDDEASCAAVFDLIYRLLEKLEVMKRGQSRLTHCLHRPKLVNSSAQTDLAGVMPPVIKTDSCEPDSPNPASAVKRFLSICQVSPASKQDKNGFMRVTTESRSLSSDGKDGRRGSGTINTERNDGPSLTVLDTSNDLQHTTSMEMIAQQVPQRGRSNSREITASSKLDIPFVANPLARRLSMQTRDFTKADPCASLPKPTTPTVRSTARSNTPSSPRVITAKAQPLLVINDSLQAALSTRRKSFNTMTDAVTSLFQKK